jgi:hypothetical protein
MEEWPAKGDYFLNSIKYQEAAHPELDANEKAEFATRLFASEEAAAQGLVRAKDHPDLAAWVKANEKPLDLVVKASRCRGFFVPCVSFADPPEFQDVLMRFYLAKSRDLARGLLYRSMLKAGEGDFDGASAGILALHRFARVLPHDATVIEYLVALSIDRMASDGDQRLTKAGESLTAAAARKHLLALESLPAFPAPVVTFDRGERFMGLAFFMAVAREGLNEPLARLEGQVAAFMDPNETGDYRVPDIDLDFDQVLRDEIKLGDRLLAAGKQTTFAQRRAAFAKLNEGEGILDEVKAVVKENPGWFVYRKRLKAVIEKVGTTDRKKLTKAVSQVISWSDFFSPEKVFELGDRARAFSELGKTSLALAAYKAEKGDFPGTLEALVPGYLKAIPTDVFTDKPLILKRDGKACIVYSVGPNMKDDGGRQSYAATKPAEGPPFALPQEEEDDIAVRVE